MLGDRTFRAGVIAGRGGLYLFHHFGKSLPRFRLHMREPAGPVRVPAMFAWGNRDRFVSRAAAGLCGRYVTGPYRFTELDGASHWLPEQAADQVAALLTEHFAATP